MKRDVGVTTLNADNNAANCSAVINSLELTLFTATWAFFNEQDPGLGLRSPRRAPGRELC